jgi:hypothetical protein
MKIELEVSPYEAFVLGEIKYNLIDEQDIVSADVISHLICLISNDIKNDIDGGVGEYKSNSKIIISQCREIIRLLSDEQESQT